MRIWNFFSGWKHPGMTIARYLGCALVLCLSGPEIEATEAAPPVELLEFVGSWEAEDGDWFDPSQLEGWFQGARDEREHGEDDV